ncbi:MAG TPA: hypothetical protein VGM80_04345 [Gaiellaceae bacterium]|jgi:hypothetical protein
MKGRVTLAALVGILATAAGTASASAPPVGPIPAPAVTTLTTAKGSLVSIALPHRVGYDWRIARALDPKVVREVAEGDVGSNVVLVFKAVSAGRASIVVAQTRGERSKAYRAVRYDVHVT